jgi:hypothetical protein
LLTSDQFFVNRSRFVVSKSKDSKCCSFLRSASSDACPGRALSPSSPRPEAYIAPERDRTFPLPGGMARLSRAAPTYRRHVAAIEFESHCPANRSERRNAEVPRLAISAQVAAGIYAVNDQLRTLLRRHTVGLDIAPADQAASRRSRIAETRRVRVPPVGRE